MHTGVDAQGAVQQRIRAGVTVAGEAGGRTGDGREGAIFDAAFTVFTRYGFQRCTIDDIAREAGMSRPALYQYFKNKRAIYRGLVGQLVGQMVTGLEAGLKQPGPVAEVLALAYEAAVMAPLASVVETPHGPELVGMGGDLADDLFDDMYERKRVVLAEFFRRRMASADAQRAEALANLTIDAFEGAKLRTAGVDALREAFNTSAALIGAMVDSGADR